MNDLVITPGEWETRDGRKAVVLTTDVPNKEHPIIGWYLDPGCGTAKPASWCIDGKCSTLSYSNLDLIHPWVEKPKTRKVKLAPFLMVDSHGKWYLTTPCEEDDIGVSETSIRWMKELAIEVEVTE